MRQYRWDTWVEIHHILECNDPKLNDSGCYYLQSLVRACLLVEIGYLKGVNERGRARVET